MSSSSVGLQGHLALDAGPLIALAYARDPRHELAERGIEQLAAARIHVLTPLAIAFEVYKWVLYEVGERAARDALATIVESTEIVLPSLDDWQAVTRVLVDMPNWAGALEDALVAVTGLRMDVPVWTMNYRDLAAFRGLRFWTPE